MVDAFFLLKNIIFNIFAFFVNLPLPTIFVAVSQEKTADSFPSTNSCNVKKNRDGAAQWLKESKGRLFHPPSQVEAILIIINKKTLAFVVDPSRLGVGHLFPCPFKLFRCSLLGLTRHPMKRVRNWSARVCMPVWRAIHNLETGKGNARENPSVRRAWFSEKERRKIAGALRTGVWTIIQFRCDARSASSGSGRNAKFWARELVSCCYFRSHVGRTRTWVCQMSHRLD